MTTSAAAPASRAGRQPHTGRKRSNFAVRWFMRVPPLLYRVGLARQAGNRFLLLTTTGRKSGLPRTCGLNYFRDGDRVYVVSGWGTGADWYRNLLAHPQVRVQIGTEHWQATARAITDRAARRALVPRITTDPRQGPPGWLRGPLKLIGFDYEASVQQSAARADNLPAVELELTTRLPA